MMESPIPHFQLFKTANINGRQFNGITFVSLAVGNIDGVGDGVIRMVGEYIETAVVEGIWRWKDTAGVINYNGNFPFDAIGCAEFWNKRDAATGHISVSVVGDENITNGVLPANVAVTVSKAQFDERGVSGKTSRQGIFGHAEVFDLRDDRVLRWRDTAKSECQQEKSAGKKKYAVVIEVLHAVAIFAKPS